MSGHRLLVPLPPDASEFATVRFLPVPDWLAARARWADALGLDVERVSPGARLGEPSGRPASAKRAVMEDAVHPGPGVLWVGARLRDELARATLRGVAFAAVELPIGGHAPDLWELVVGGRAWRQGSSEENVRACDVCGRRGFPRPKSLTVDESRWDGSDFFFLDENPNIIVVSERVADVFESNEFSNVLLEPIR